MQDIVRGLNAQVQEMKGNIRVFCRVRPLIAGETDTTETADGPSTKVLGFPSGMDTPHEISLMGREAIEVLSNTNQKGPETRHMFGFDRVFTPTSSQEDVFEEISGLVRSALDGYTILPTYHIRRCGAMLRAVQTKEEAGKHSPTS